MVLHSFFLSSQTDMRIHILIAKENFPGGIHMNRTAAAYVSGGPLRPQIRGLVRSHDTLGGTIVTAQISSPPS